MCLSLLTVSCGLREIGGDGGQFKDDGVWVGSAVKPTGPEHQTGRQKVWYAVGMDYPDDYDWRKDEDAGQVKCSLVVFANGIPSMKVAVGDAYEVSSDPDTHRMFDGSLYTDFSSEDETVIKRDGIPLFRYPGRETICDMVVDGEDVYTLGHSRDGRGFAFRKNGEVILERSLGYTFGRLQKDSTGISYAFCETIVSESGVHERYYLSRCGTLEQVAVRDDVKMVWDIALHNGEVCYLADVVGIDEVVLFRGQAIMSLTLSKSVDRVSYRFLPGTSDLYVEGMAKQMGGDSYSVLWKNGQRQISHIAGQTIMSYCVADGDLCYVTSGLTFLRPAVISRYGEAFSMPPGYFSMGGKSMAVKDGMLYVGLTSTSDGNPAVWVDDEVKPLKINGFISHIHVH